jgi:hypothetical protein
VSPYIKKICALWSCASAFSPIRPPPTRTKLEVGGGDVTSHIMYAVALRRHALTPTHTTHTNTHTYTHTHTHPHTHTPSHTLTHTLSHTDPHTLTHTHDSVYVWIYMYLQTQELTHIYSHTLTYTCIHTHTHTPTHIRKHKHKPRLLGALSPKRPLSPRAPTMRLDGMPGLAASSGPRSVQK